MALKIFGLDEQVHDALLGSLPVSATRPVSLTTILDHKALMCLVLPSTRLSDSFSRPLPRLSSRADSIQEISAGHYVLSAFPTPTACLTGHPQIYSDSLLIFPNTLQV